MKIYIASNFERIPDVKVVAYWLESEGHEITVKWWAREYEIPGEGKVPTSDLKVRFEDLGPEDFYSRPETERSFKDDLKGIEASDVLVFLAGPKPLIFNGANVEFGAALAWGKPRIIFGAHQKSAMYWGAFRCSHFAELRHILRTLSNV